MLGCTSEQNPQVHPGLVLSLGYFSAQPFLERCGSFQLAGKLNGFLLYFRHMKSVIAKRNTLEFPPGRQNERGRKNKVLLFLE